METMYTLGCEISMPRSAIHCDACVLYCASKHPKTLLNNHYHTRVQNASCAYCKRITNNRIVFISIGRYSFQITSLIGIMLASG
uniref:Uncharacterized protein n=1 Tax=Anguilla anguilla TaxID=7936 RepID=A0A0E9RHS5_ANGAN